MKNSIPIRRISIEAILFTGVLIAASAAIAQDNEITKTTTTSTSSEGFLSELGIGTFAIRTEASPDPVHYSRGQKTKYVDEKGNPVSVTAMKSGQLVTVFFTRDGKTMIASTVMVRREFLPPAKTIESTPTTTMSNGIISGFDDERIILNLGAFTGPVTYSHSKTTTYIDEDDNPVSLETVKTGLPVTISHTGIGDKLTATRVLVRRAPVVEE